MWSERVGRMATKTPIDQLSSAIDSIMEEYADAVNRSSQDCVKAVAKSGARAVQQAAQGAFAGKEYASGWTSRVDETRFGAVGVIYNKNQPGLPHLLEHGHVSRNGTGRTFGMVAGVEHIAPVEQKIVEEFENKIRMVVSR